MGFSTRASSSTDKNRTNKSSSTNKSSTKKSSTAENRRDTAHRAKRRSAAGVVAALVAVGGVVAVPTLAAQPAEAATTPTVSLVWSKNFGISGKPVALSSPMVATLDGGGSSVVIGDRAGYERAYHLSNGSGLKGWPVSTGGVAVDSTASVRGSGSGARVYFGEGNSATPSKGGYRAIASTGKIAWSLKPKAEPGKPATAGVMSGLAIGNMQSDNSVVGGSMGQTQLLIDASTGAIGKGFPWFQADSNFTTPAVSTLGMSGRDLIVEGGDSTAGIAFGKRYANGGHIRILKPTGNAGTGNQGGGLRCEYNTTQVVQSSPAVGPFLTGGKWGAVAGTGKYYKGASDTNKVIAIDSSCHPIWKANLGGITDSSPALADVKGTGHTWVVAAGRISNTSSRVSALDGSNGRALWSTTVPGGVYGGVTSADLTGAGYQDVIVPTVTGTYIIDGRSGKTVAKVGAGYGFQNSALVTNDPDGSIGLTLAGYNGKNQGTLLHYRFTNAGAKGANVNKKGAWPMFHHDQKLTGDSQTVLTAKP